MSAASGIDHGSTFSFRTTKHGDVTILRGGKAVTVLRGAAARRFLVNAAGATPTSQQRLMARATGNYKRGNERLAGNHGRNPQPRDA